MRWKPYWMGWTEVHFPCRELQFSPKQVKTNLTKPQKMIICIYIWMKMIFSANHPIIFFQKKDNICIINWDAEYVILIILYCVISYCVIFPWQIKIVSLASKNCITVSTDISASIFLLTQVTDSKRKMILANFIFHGWKRGFLLNNSSTLGPIVFHM